MVPVGESYQPSGQLTLRSLAITLILGVFSAVVVAGMFWLWEISPIPSLVLITAMLQGLVVGLVLAGVIGRLHMRNPRVAAAIGFLCGLLSIGLVHYGHHLAAVQGAADALRAEIQQDARLDPQKKQQILAALEKNPHGVVNAFLKDATGYGGFIGTMILRNRDGITIKHSQVSGILLWLLWGIEASFVAFVAMGMASERASRLYCDDCADWCVKQPDLVTLPGSNAQPLVAAIQNNDAAQVVQIRSAPLPSDASDQVIVTLHHCPHCDQAFAEVTHRQQVGKDKVKNTILMQKVRVSPEIAEALRQGLQTAPELDDPNATPAPGDDEPTLVKDDDSLPPAETMT